MCVLMQVSRVTAGVQSVVAYSPNTTSIWLHPLTGTGGQALSSWQNCWPLSCKTNEGGVAGVCSGADHTLILTKSGKCMWKEGLCS